ncbi:MAG: hypothetical protein HUK02_10010 [Bacteroidaceae bacterium]|nr:hypothetical protein [Bacteroidaceae bacterium]
MLPIHTAADYVTATIGSAQYATMYYGDKNLIVPTGVEAYTYMLDAEGKLDESWVYEAGDVIPAGTGVVLYSETPQSYAFVETTETGDVDTDNLLRGSDEAELTTGGDKYYMLSLNAAGDASSVGFYWGADNGAAFMNGAHKAYLALPAGTEIRSAYLLNGDDEATAIREVSGNTEKAVFSLTGMRLRNSHLMPGLYIVNGKKVMVK